MAKKLPYFKIYPAEIETDEWHKSLPDSVYGYYMRLLNHCWINGSVPADPKTRCRLMKIHPKTDHAAFKELSSKLQADPIDSSRLVSTELQEQAKEALEKSRSAMESVKHRYERSSSSSVERSPSVPLLASSASSSASSSDSSSEEIKDVGEPWDWFCSEFKGEVEADAWKEFMGQVTSPELLATMQQNLPLWMKTSKYESGHGKGARWFIRDGLWRNPPNSALMGKKSKREEFWDQV